MSIDTRKGIVPAVIVALLVSLSACAQDQSRAQRIAAKAQERFAAADANHDGSLSLEETQKGLPRLAEHFGEIDADHDGQLSTTEILAYFRQRRGSR
jgi:Ca2+-binding EF-hand superfamily protein